MLQRVDSRVSALSMLFALVFLMLIMVPAYTISVHVYPHDGAALASVFLGLSVALAAILLPAVWLWNNAMRQSKAAANTLESQNIALLKAIEGRSSADAELQRAKEKAESANLAKSRYVVGLSHELRTPLNAVMGYAQILERDPAVPENRRGAVQVIRRSAEHLSSLIDGLLDISKIEAGRLQVYSDEINIQDFLDQLVDMFRLQAQAKGIEFRHTRAQALPVHVRTDQKRLRQILVNLLSNAIKFTSAGHVSFEVGYRMQVATFAVTDTGSGIGPNDIDHIFEPFVRGEAERNRFTPGLGLGLTITKLLTETLGGEITVASTLGEGTRFQARLMLAKVERPVQRVAVRDVIGYAGNRATIMVVDDNEDHRELMREMVAPLGFTVLMAADGPSCLAALQTASPDLFFVDIRMPGMSGWELVATMRNRGVTAPIIMLSANVGDGGNPTGKDAGHTDTLAKPFDMAQLIDKLGTHLGLDWVHAAVPASVEPLKLRSPGVEHLRELASLGQIGHVRGIDAKLRALAAVPANQPLVDTLRRHMDEFDFDAYAETLERVGHEPH